jgi:hypothetical protein
MAQGMLISLAQTSKRVPNTRVAVPFGAATFFARPQNGKHDQLVCCDVPPDARPKLQAPTPRGKETRPSETADPQPRRLNLNLRD